VLNIDPAKKEKSDVQPVARRDATAASIITAAVRPAYGSVSRVRRLSQCHVYPLSFVPKSLHILNKKSRATILLKLVRCS